MQLESFIPEKMLCANDRFILGFKKGCIIARNFKDKKIVQKKKIHGAIKSIPVVERLMRLEPRAACSLTNDVFLFSDHGFIFKYTVSQNSIEIIHKFSKGMNNPLTFCLRKDDKGNPIELVYGEYIWNTEKGPVSIFKYNLSSCKEVYSFPSNTIMHIHNIVFDDYYNRYIIMTGDENKESAIWTADINFSNVKQIIGGSQKYRACIAFPTEKGIFYATDTPLEQNWLYFYDYSDGLKEIYKMPGPCIYGRVFNNALYMATSVEGNPTLGGWKYRLSNKLGKGVKDRNVHIIKCDKTGNVSEVGTLKKDALPMWLFQFGNAQFPPANDNIYISTQSTVEKGTYKLNEGE